MNFNTGSIVALDAVFISTAARAATAPASSNASAAPDVKVMTQTQNPAYLQQQKKTGEVKARRPASDASKAAP
jgi:hypothetical protein